MRIMSKALKIGSTVQWEGRGGGDRGGGERGWGWVVWVGLGEAARH